MDHPNIIKLHEVYESSKYIHLLCPYLEGGELFERIKSKGLYQEKNAAKVMTQFLSALAFMETKRIVHRDLKPENLILVSKGDDTNIQIADFGLASYMPSNSDLLYLRCGSPGYVAPEMLADNGYDCKSDVFSAGVICYVMLSGRPAFKGKDVQEVLAANKKCEPDFPDKYWSTISPEAKDLVNKLLVKDPAQRISAKDALQHPWFSRDFTEVRHNTNRLEVSMDTQKDMTMLSATPVMAGRKLRDLPPETPFL
jgi:calcium/calmodulin-dependent protein kinase I